MSHINCGAAVNGAPPQTKKALKEAVANEPENICLRGTSPFTPIHTHLTCARITDTYSIVGPDPHRKRDWYANISWNSKKEIWICT